MKLRLTPEEPREGVPLGPTFDEVFSARLREADEFYEAIALAAQMNTYGLGTAGEIFDGDPPFRSVSNRYTGTV